MPVIVNARLALWHLPKTGGTWACRALAAAEFNVHQLHPQHASPLKSGGESWREHAEAAPVQATILRRPFDWYWSVWRYLRTPGQETDPVLYLPLVERGMWAKRDLDEGQFGQFCMKFAGFYSDLIREFTNPRGVVLRTEHLADDLLALLRNAFPGVKYDPGKIRFCPPENVGRKEKRPDDRDLERLVNQSEPAYWLACN